MARIQAIKASEDYALRLNALGEHTEDAVTAAIRAGSDILADAVRKGFEGVLKRNSDGEMENSTGQMMEHMGITPVKMDRDGWWNAKIGFHGYDVRKTRKWSRGVPHQLKARVLESGTKDGRIQGHEVIKKAVQKAMQKELDTYFEKYMGGI